MMPTKQTTDRGVVAAQRYLKRMGHDTLGEIMYPRDGALIVSMDEDELVFTDLEIQTDRDRLSRLQPTAGKLDRLIEMAHAYLDDAGIDLYSMRIDTVRILVLADGHALLRHSPAIYREDS